MAGPYNPPKRNETFEIRIGLTDGGDPLSFLVDPDIEAGDFQVDVDGTGFTNLTTLPSVSPSGSVAVVLSLSADEMNGDVITIVGIDQTDPKAWADVLISIPTTV